MRTLPLAKLFRHAAILIAAITVSQGVGAATNTTNAGYVRYTSGTAEVRKDRNRDVPAVVSPSVPNQEIKPWQVASVDSSVISGQTSTIAMRATMFELPASANFDADASVPQKEVVVARSADPLKNREPGLWAPAMSTLALALFFFLRRLA